MAVELIGKDYRIWIPHELRFDSVDDENADIHIHLDDGSHYTGTLYTIANILHLMDKFARTGECAGGKYMFDPTMLIVRDLRPETIQAVVEELIHTGKVTTVLFKCDD